jgi:two-component system, chemotaxis family, protein-glutamate methylesterase/glutaminase
MALLRSVADVESRALARVLIIDDSAVARAVLARICGDLPDTQVVASVSNAGAALSFLQANSVEVILLDIDMPGTDGLSALPDLRTAARGARIIVVSSTCEEGSAAAVQAMALGAADTLAKPRPGMMSGSFAADLGARFDRLWRDVEDGPTTAKSDLPQLRPFDVIAISASTGGIHAMSQVLRALPRSFDVPILITQHLPSSFMPYFSAQLALLADRPCTVASNDTIVARGRVLVAPGDAHMTVERSSRTVRVRLTEGRAPSGCMPSADPMLSSVAEVYGARALAVTLSGMGRDGVHGAAAIAAADGQVIVQDAESAVIWGMPGAVARAGDAMAVLSPDQIGALLAGSVS